MGDTTNLPSQEALRHLVERLQRKVHDDAVHVNALYSSEHWKHNAGIDWPQEPDDDSYLAFENCVHPDCVLARSALLVSAASSQPPQALCVCESVFWNPFNKVTQCHRCGQSFTGTEADVWQGAAPSSQEAQTPAMHTCPKCGPECSC